MESRPKKRVLSLSLSQPSKQNRKLKLKRHASTTTERECHPSQCQDSLQKRDDVKISTSKTVSSPILHLEDRGSFDDSIFHESGTSNPYIIAGQDENAAENLTACEAEGHSRKTFVSTISTREKGSGHELKTSVTEMQGESACLVRIKVEPAAHTLGEPLNREGSVNQINSKGQSSLCSEIKMESAKRKSLSACRATEGESSSDISPSFKNANTLLEEEQTSMDHPECEEYHPILQCPLCSKTFEKLTTKTTHVKTCASKHKVSTQQLLEILKLQQKQAAERKALGLPGIQPALEKLKKPSLKKETRAISKMDSNLQLAVALSLSMQDQVHVLADSSVSEAAKVVSLDQFGFTSKSVLDSVQPRPSATLISKGKMKGLKKGLPTLLTRSTEERQQIITEKVAMVLLEEVAADKKDNQEAVSVKSSFLQECLDKETALWAKSHTSPSKSDRTSFYVQNLRGFISPSKVEMGSKVLHLSQVVGRMKTPTKVQEEQDYKKSSAQLTDDEISSDSSLHQQLESNKPSHIEMELRAKLFNDWASMVNNSTMSDLAIYPQEGRDIPVHKIVLHTRCPRILQDICRQRNPLTGNEVEVIMWSKTPHAAALAFLEYVYCGSVKSIRVLSEDLSSILWLANYYKVADLIKYLNAVSAANEAPETPSQVALSVVQNCSEQIVNPVECPDKSKTENDKATLLLNKRNVTGLRKQPRTSLDMFASPVGTPRSETDSIYSESTIQGAGNRSSCSSPDLFFDDDVRLPGNSDEDGHSSDNPVCLADGVSVNCPPVTKLLSCNETSDRPPSRSVSVSSEKTVIVEKNSPAANRCPSVASEETVLLENNSAPASPTSSNASAVTEVLEFNQSEPERPSMNDSKRKHSGSSQDGDTSCSKRPCPVSSTPGQQLEKKESDVEFCDLTQDSDSSASLPVTSKYCDDICISPDIENCNVQDKNKISDEEREGNISNESSKNDSIEKVNESNETGRHNYPGRSEEPYVSPVWDGFEDLHYEDPYFSEIAINSNSPPKETVSLDSPILISSLSPKCNESLPSDCKSPEESGSVNKEGYQQVSKPKEAGSSSDCEMTYQSPNELRERSNPSTSSFNALLDDSLNVNDSILERAENSMHGKLTQKGTKGTPVNRVLSSASDGVTPLANYSAMKTPELKRELQKYGLKPTLGKRKGKIMLRHIYNELHPWVPIKSDSLQKNVTLSQPVELSKYSKDILPSSPSNSRRLSFTEQGSDTEPSEKELGSTESDSDSDSGDNRTMSSREIQYLEENEIDAEPMSQTSSHRVSKADLPKIVSDFIRKDRELFKQVLEYEPIWVEKLQADLRTNGYKLKMQDLMTFLDEKCITFRSTPSGPRVKRRKPKDTIL